MESRKTPKIEMTMTPAQEKSYMFHRSLGWEYSHDDGDCVIVQLWQQDTMESRTLFAEVAIDQEGNHRCVDSLHNAEAIHGEKGVTK